MTYELHQKIAHSILEGDVEKAVAVVKSLVRHDASGSVRPVSILEAERRGRLALRIPFAVELKKLGAARSGGVVDQGSVLFSIPVDTVE